MRASHEVLTSAFPNHFIFYWQWCYCLLYTAKFCPSPDPSVLHPSIIGNYPCLQRTTSLFSITPQFTKVISNLEDLYAQTMLRPSKVSSNNVQGSCLVCTVHCLWVTFTQQGSDNQISSIFPCVGFCSYSFLCITKNCASSTSHFPFSRIVFDKLICSFSSYLVS